MVNQELAEILEQIAFLAELKDENPFKVRAFAKASGIVADLAEPVDKLIKSGEIKKVAGIGKGILAIAQEFLAGARVSELEALKQGLPEGILEMREVRGLGPKKIKALYEQLGIGSLSELEYACEENRLIDLKGFGEKTQASILKNLQTLMSNRGKVILPVALQMAEEVQQQLLELENVRAVEVTGELRRLAEVVSSLDFIFDGPTNSLLEAGFQEKNGAWLQERDGGLPIRVFPVRAADAGSRLLETTGPAEFIAKLGKISSSAEETELFRAMGKPFIPPECRELGIVSPSLIEEKQIRGVFHLHTSWSDGKDSLEEMAVAAMKLGYEYIGISDHSQSAIYARGLDENRVLQQKKEIEAVQKKFPLLRIFHGIESDILNTGSLDYPQDFLKNFDFVIASVHGQMRMGREEMTKRLCRAIKNPATTFLGHWTGRLLLGREGYDFDEEEVLKCAAGEGKSIELNSNPYRLDIDWRLLPRAVQLGIPIGIFPDAHSVGGLRDTRFGVWMARKAGLSPSAVLNTKSLKELEAWLQETKRC